MNNPVSHRNGWTDDGSQLKNGGTKCPNCGSSDFTESLSREKCNACGLECNYWGGGANEVYTAMMERNYREEERLREDRWRKEQEEERAAQEAMNGSWPAWYNED